MTQLLSLLGVLKKLVNDQKCLVNELELRLKT